MREILFRGKKISNGEWVYGGIMQTFHPNFDNDSVETFLQQKPNCYCICADGKDVFVEQSSICQYTGLTDKNGKKIFEGDIVKAQITQNLWTKVKKYIETYVVEYHKNYCYFYLKKSGNNLLFDGNWQYAVDICEVIGNIHDNAELLEEESNGKT